jgi:hypothetical protein
MKKILLLSLIPFISHATENSSFSIAAARDHYWSIREKIAATNGFCPVTSDSDVRIIRAVSSDENSEFGGSFDRIEYAVDAGRKGFICFAAYDDTQASLKEVKDFHASLFDSIQTGWVPVGETLDAGKPELAIKKPSDAHRLFLKMKMAFRSGRVISQRIILDELALRNGLSSDIACSDKVITSLGDQQGCDVLHLWVDENALDNVQKKLGLGLIGNTQKTEQSYLNTTLGYIQNSLGYATPKSNEWLAMQDALQIIKKRYDR